MILLISADLKSDKSYDGFFNTIKSVPFYWHYLESVWLVKTDESAQVWSTRLRAQMNEQTDFLLVTRVDLVEYGGWLPQKAWDWIQEHRFANQPPTSVLSQVTQHLQPPSAN